MMYECEASADSLDLRVRSPTPIRAIEVLEHIATLHGTAC